MAFVSFPRLSYHEENDIRQRRGCSHLTVNLGKWILRYLFANLIDEEIRRDEAYRAKLNEAVDKRIAAAAAAQAGGRANAPSSIQLPPLNVSGLALSGDSSGATPRANGHHAPMTPGMSIGLAKPGPVTHLPGVPEGAALASPTSPYEKHSSAVSQPSVDKEDYFSSAIMSVDAPSTAAKPAAPPPKTTEGGADDKAKEGAADHGKDKDKEAANNAKSSSTTFGKKFRMGNPFGSKKLSRSASTNTEKTAAATATTTEDAKEGEGGASESSSNADKDAPLVDDSLGGVVQRLRLEYDRQVADQPDRHVESRIRPSLPSDTPVLKLPPQTKIILQEETSGGSANLYRGTVASTGADADIIERCAATWLGEVLLLVSTIHAVCFDCVRGGP